jgi:hypothetical protein
MDNVIENQKPEFSKTANTPDNLDFNLYQASRERGTKETQRDSTVSASSANILEKSWTAIDSVITDRAVQKRSIRFYNEN